MTSVSFVPFVVRTSSVPTSVKIVFDNIANELADATIVEPEVSEQLDTQTTPQYVLHIYDNFRVSSASAQAPEPSELCDNKTKIYGVKAQCWEPSFLPHSLRERSLAGLDDCRGQYSPKNLKKHRSRLITTGTIKDSKAKAVIETKEDTYLPKDGSEENKVATWLNRVTAALRSFAPSSSSGIQTRTRKMQMLVDTQRVRVWSAEFTARQASMDFDLEMRPDIALLKKDPFNLKRQTHFSLAAKQLTRGAYAVFMAQPGRRYVVAPSICHMNFRFHLFDRAGVIHSRAHSSFFVRVLYTLAFAPEECIGYDPTLFFSPIITRSNSLRTPPATIRVDDDIFNIIKLLFDSDTICGRGTLCFHVKNPATSKEYVVKTSWTDNGHATTEEKIMMRIKEKGLIHEVSTLVKAWTVQINGVDDSTALRRPDYLQHHSTRGSVSPAIRDNQQHEVRIHRRLVLGHVGIPIEDFLCIQELINVLIDIVGVHEQLVTLCGVLHRDISVKNLMMYVPAENEPEYKWPISSSDPKLCARLRERDEVLQRRKYRRGLLIDFDRAKLMDEESAVSGGESGTGTIPFMAIDMLLAFGSAARNSSTVTVSHEPRHDLESIIYVLVWICVLYPGPNLVPIPIQETWLRMWVGCNTGIDIVCLSDAKLGQAIDRSRLKHFTPYFKRLETYVARMYKAILANTRNLKNNLNPLTHDMLKDILLDAFFNVQEPKSDPPAERAREQRDVTAPAKRKPEMDVEQGEVKRSRQS